MSNLPTACAVVPWTRSAIDRVGFVSVDSILRIRSNVCKLEECACDATGDTGFVWDGSTSCCVRRCGIICQSHHRIAVRVYQGAQTDRTDVDGCRLVRWCSETTSSGAAQCLPRLHRVLVANHRPDDELFPHGGPPRATPPRLDVHSSDRPVHQRRRMRDNSLDLCVAI
jgi:hypothetical protein